MKILPDAAVRDLTTMRIGGRARYLIVLESPADIPTALDFAEAKNLPWRVLGGGANSILPEFFDGALLLNKIEKIEKLSETEFSVGAGEILDEIVRQICDLNLSGVETLAKIPGSVGGATVQNAGAFGQEISDVIESVEAFDVQARKFIQLNHKDCRFAYRDSLFQNPAGARYIISEIKIRLSPNHLQPPFYWSLQNYLDEKQIENYAPRTIYDAVATLRTQLLPDPIKIPSAGSFFKNPIVDENSAARILADFPDAPHWPTAGGKIKLSAKWLIQTAGLADFRTDHFKFYENNALVIVGDGHSDASELREFADQIIQKVQTKFDVELEPEPEFF
jgi:UDP-N-acetylmuramate dehydrogenase